MGDLGSVCEPKQNEETCKTFVRKSVHRRYAEHAGRVLSCTYDPSSVGQSLLLGHRGTQRERDLCIYLDMLFI